MKAKKEQQKFINEYESSIWYDFKDIYQHTKQIYNNICKFKSKPILISIGRGGWIFSRILSAFLERDGVEHNSFTVTTSYINRNSANERPVFVQKLDNNSVSKIKKLLAEGNQIWILDVPYVTGGTMSFVKKFMEKKFNCQCKSAVLHVVKFKEIKNFSWRKPPTKEPDFYAIKIESDKTNWYVQYPWEWTDLEMYDTVCNAYKNKSKKETLKEVLEKL